MKIASKKVVISVLLCLLVVALVTHVNFTTPRTFIPSVKYLGWIEGNKTWTPTWYGLSEKNLKVLTWDDLSEDDQNFLDKVQQAAFWYFWNETNPKTGIVQNRASNPKLGDIAAVGLALSAICIAESHGWITYEEAYDRVLTTLRSFNPENPLVEGTHGFFYHWVDRDTGKRLDNAEISLIDNGLLIAGVLHAGQHFKGTDIETLADKIYRAAEWDWLLLDNGLMKITGEIEQGVKGYSEYILSYILALGSPTHPIPERSWDAWASGYQWVEYKGFKFLSPGPYFNAYLYQFPACWIDFRNKHDKYANYWLNAAAALKANRQFCLDASASAGWPPLWGWTACDGKNGYLMWGTPFDGTVAPSAVAASIPFIPEDAIPMLKKMYEDYGEKVWGKYGFVNSFNVAQNWYDNDYIGIDQGNIVLSIENFRTGMVWREFMEIPYVKEGMRKAGFVSYQEET